MALCYLTCYLICLILLLVPRESVCMGHANVCAHLPVCTQSSLTLNPMWCMWQEMG